MALHAWVYGCYQSHPPLGPLEPVARSETTEVWIRGYASRPTYENNASPLFTTYKQFISGSKNTTSQEILKFWLCNGDVLCVDYEVLVNIL